MEYKEILLLTRARMSPNQTPVSFPRLAAECNRYGTRLTGYTLRGWGLGTIEPDRFQLLYLQAHGQGQVKQFADEMLAAMEGKHEAEAVITH